MSSDPARTAKHAIAIVGMACRVPGANTLAAFWDTIVRGQESIGRFDDRQLRAAGVDDTLIGHPDYVRAKGAIDHADQFDAALFRFTPREAALLDPQHRVMLECAWEALDHAGYGAPDRRLRVGVYAGVGLNTYLLRNLASHPDLVASEGEHQLLFFSDKDFVPTRISYQFDLSGPSVNVQTACSTSLVAVHMACQSLLAYYCDMALAGGAAITTPLAHGYLYREGGILSPDGHCRPFDAAANGTVVGNGAGMVVLKRLEDAVGAGDVVHAVILGSAVNNDGADKVGYTAPSITGQAAVIAEAQALAGVAPESIGYVEAHGTGTALGDPIEVAALTQAFRRAGAQGTAWCALGSVKSNVGHVDIAAGVVGLIKTVLSLQHQTIAPTVHYTRPNPALALDSSPFRIPAQAEAWLAGTPRRAGVSAFGIGGTNAHVVLEEASARAASGPSRRWQVLPFSAHTPAALAALDAKIAAVVRDQGLPLADVAYTLAVGRRVLRERGALVVDAGEGSGSRDEADAIARQWIAGEEIDWPAYFAGESRQRVVLPPYPFERQRYWIDPAASAPARPASASADSIDGLLYQPSWTRAAELPSPSVTGRWLIVADAVGVGAALADRLSATGAVVTVVPAADLEDFTGVIEQAQPDRVVHLGNVTGATPADRAAARLRGYASVAALGEALAQSRSPIALTVVSDGMQAVSGQEVICAEKALVLGPVRVLPQEHPTLRCRSLDIEATGINGERLTQLVAECASDDPEPVVAHRGRHRWVPSFAPLKPVADTPALRRGGVYLITGGMGGVGLTLAKHLFETTGANLVLTGRTPLPTLEEWKAVGADDRITLEIEDESQICDPPRQTDQLLQAAVSPRDALVDARAIAAADAVHEASRTTPPLAERADIAPLLDEIAVSHIYEYFAAAGIDLPPGTRLRAGDLAARIGVLSDYTRFVDFFVQVLVEDGYARREDAEVIVERAAPASSAELRRRVAADHPWLSPLLDLLAHSAAHYHEAMCGRIDALAVLYPKGGSELFERAVAAMADHARHRQYGAVIGSMLQRLVDQQADAPLRILEIGGGNGFLTRQVARTLAGRKVEYVFTDISRAFVDRARGWAAAEGLDHMRFGVFDITRDAAAQGWNEPFDVVLALDAVHATKDVEASVTNLRRVLRPGGVLYLLETLPPARWNTMAWGLARDWWRFDDRVRTTSPLLSTDRWLDVLRTAGFGSVGAHRSDSPRADCALYFAQCQIVPASPKLARESHASEGGPSEAIAALRAAGAEILTLTADVTSVEQMTDALALTRQRFGTLHGVVHAASEPVAIRPASDAPAPSAKTHGVRVLAQVLADQPLDFLLLCSSTASLLGGVGMADYAAANAFLDAFAHERAPRAFPVASVNWDSWRGVGMAPDIEARYAARVGEALAGGLTVTQALACFDRIVSLPRAAQVVASSADFTAAARRAEHDITAVASRIASAPQHARPAMSTPFTEPRTEVERRVAAVWEETLGVAPIGRDDDYSELGGDSLIAIKVVSRLRDALELELRVAALYDWPTVARLAQHIETIRWAAAPVRAPGLGADEDEGTL